MVKKQYHIDPRSSINPKQEKSRNNIVSISYSVKKKYYVQLDTNTSDKLDEMDKNPRKNTLSKTDIRIKRKSEQFSTY